MSETWGFLRLLGTALIVLALVSPMAYCEAESQRSRNSIMLACIEAKGEWSQWSRSCNLPKVKS